MPEKSRLRPPALALALLGATLVAPAVPAGDWSVSGPIEGKKHKPAEDVSGLACAPEAEGARQCLIIDDETQFAQWATLAGQTITAGARVPLIADVFDGKPVELDGEGAAYADGAFYVIGSYGAPRTGAPDPESAARIKADSHLFRITPSGAATPGVTDAADLRAILLADPDLAPFADKDLADNGLTVEGVAVAGGVAYIGFRGPALGKAKDRAAILPVPLATLFGGAPVPADLRARQLPLGPGTGVRDLAAVGDEILVLAGPVGDEDADHMAKGAYRLVGWNPQTDALREVGVVSVATRTNKDGAVKPNKPEAIQPLAAKDGQLEVLILSDGPENGAPTSARFAW